AIGAHVDSLGITGVHRGPGRLGEVEDGLRPGLEADGGVGLGGNDLKETDAQRIVLALGLRVLPPVRFAALLRAQIGGDVLLAPALDRRQLLQREIGSVQAGHLGAVARVDVARKEGHREGGRRERAAQIRVGLVESWAGSSLTSSVTAMGTSLSIRSALAGERPAPRVGRFTPRRALPSPGTISYDDRAQAPVGSRVCTWTVAGAFDALVTISI